MNSRSCDDHFYIFTFDDSIFGTLQKILLTRHGHQTYVTAQDPLQIILLTASETELFKVISDEAPDAIKAGEIKNHFGRKVAIVSRN